MSSSLRLDEVLDRLYDSEINFSLLAEWDNGILTRLGDEMNGFKAETFVRTTAEAATWLDKQARKHHPTSKYVTGRDLRVELKKTRKRAPQ